MAVLQAQQYLLDAVKCIEAEQYADAATCFLTILKMPVLPLPIGLYARYQGSQYLVKALIAGEYDDVVLTEEASLMQVNTILNQAETLLLDYKLMSPLMDHTPVYLHLATIQRMQARYQQALESLQVALSFERDSALIHFEYAQTCEILGLLEKAREHFQLAYEVDMSNDLIVRRYALFLRQHDEVELAKTLLLRLKDKVYVL